MKAAYLFSNTLNNHFSNHFEEFKLGLQNVGIDAFPCPKKITLKNVREYDILFFDPYHMHQNLGYIPEITDPKVFNLKLGLLTMDFWWDLVHHKMKMWLERNRVNDFIIFRHSSGLQFFEKKFDLFKDAMRDRKQHKPSSFLEPKDACINFKNVILTSFTINNDIMRLSDNIPKVYDVCFGARLFKWYPLRQRIYDVVTKSKRFKWVDPHWESPGFVLKRPREVFNEYYQGIASSWLSVATTGIANISARKYLEISALGSTCLGNHTNLPDHNIVRRNVVELDVKMSNAQIVKIIEDHLNDKQKLKRMSDSVKEEVRKKYDYRVVGKRLRQELEKLYG